VLITGVGTVKKIQKDHAQSAHWGRPHPSTIMICDPQFPVLASSLEESWFEIARREKSGFEAGLRETRVWKNPSTLRLSSGAGPSGRSCSSRSSCTLDRTCRDYNQGLERFIHWISRQAQGFNETSVCSGGIKIAPARKGWQTLAVKSSRSSKVRPLVSMGSPTTILTGLGCRSLDPFRRTERSKVAS
jgi:hypothetical protein